MNKQRDNEPEPDDLTEEERPKREKPKRSWTYVAIAVLAVIVALAILLIDPNAGENEPVNGDAAKVPAPRMDRFSREAAQSLMLAYNSAVLTPDDGSAWGKLGMTYYANESIPEAMTCFAEAEKLQPDEPRWPYLYGMVLAESDRAAGLPAVKRAADLDPDNVDVRTRLAEFHFALNQLQESRTVFMQLRDKDPRNARVLLGLARIEFTEKNWDACRQLAEEAMKNAPPRPDIHELLSRAHSRLGNAKEAETHANALSGLQNSSVDWPDKFLNEVMALRSDPAVLMEQSEVLAAAGRLEEELRVLNRLVQVDPDNPEAFTLFARALLRAGDLPTAARVVAEGAKRHSNNAELGLMQAVTALQLGNADEAIERLQEVLKRKPDYAEAHFILGNAFVKAEKIDDAIEAFRDVLRYEPLFAPAHLGLADLLTKQGKTIEAAKHAAEAQRLQRP